MGIILIGSARRDDGLSADQQFWGIVIGSGLFVLIVLIVTILVWMKPENLTFGEKSHLEARKTKGDPENLLTDKELKEQPKEAA